MEHKGQVATWVAVPLFTVFAAAYGLSHESIVIHVEDKSAGWDRPLHHEERSNYNFLVHTSDETFKVGRAWLYGDFRPAERWHRLEKGRSYKVRVAGWRVGYFHWYRNILAIEEEQSPYS